MDELNRLIAIVKSNYILVIVAAVLFFLLKALAGYLTYRRFRKDLEEIKALIKNERK
ncbi:hypothetical protein RAC89_05485 [Paenibacillus sp. GD4]|uniref:hypothetical protein n=1 Tax=Paenibacillus sp. GD4 TaxID=3068890 RepID=UPI0027964E5F|nr:hypothetical protein [Paenibacillus sp. GD4]MDQ1909946.1 hypothetical protein [Paenibacillus sp. GD4]